MLNKWTSNALIFFTLICVYLVPVAADEKVNLNGNWRADKLNFYLNIKDQLFTRYQFTSMSCFKGGAGYLPVVGSVKDGLLNDSYKIALRGADEMIISRPQEGIPTHLTRIKRIPSHCKGQAIKTPLSNFYVFWHSINEVYHFSTYSKKAWFELYNKTIEKFIDLDMRVFKDQKEEDLFLFDRLRALIYELKDAHIFLIAPSLGQTVYADEKINQFNDQYIEDPTQKYKRYELLAKYHNLELQWFNDKSIAIGYQENSKILYLAVLSLTGSGANGAYTNESMERFNNALTELRKNLNRHSIKKLIVDLRFNDGGSIQYANMLASTISNIKKTSTFIAPFRDEKKLEPLAYVNKEKADINYDIEVFVTKYTASAAEHLTLLLQDLGATIHGQETRGAYSPVILKSLPNGWIIGIPPYKTYTRDKQLLQEGVGIQPDSKINWEADDIPAFNK